MDYSHTYLDSLICRGVLIKGGVSVDSTQTNIIPFMSLKTLINIKEINIINLCNGIKFGMINLLPDY